MNQTILDIPWVEEMTIANLNALQIVHFHSSWEAFQSFRHSNAALSIFGCRLKDFFPLSKAHHSEPDLTVQHACNMHLSILTLLYRRLITTKDGYLGLAPEKVEVNDLVAILFGCSFPVVLRPFG
jgi:hypothetical protein